MCCAHFNFLYKYLIFTPNPGLCTPMSLGSPPNGHIFTPNYSSGFAPVSAIMPGHGGRGCVLCYERKVCCAKLGERGERVVFEWVSLGWCERCDLGARYLLHYPSPETNSQSGFRFHKGIGTQAPRSTQEYNLATTTLIWRLTQTLSCEMGSSLFAAMIRLKVASTTWASLPIISSTKMKNGEKNSVVHSNSACACTS